MGYTALLGILTLNCYLDSIGSSSGFTDMSYIVLTAAGVRGVANSHSEIKKLAGNYENI